MDDTPNIKLTRPSTDSRPPSRSRLALPRAGFLNVGSVNIDEVLAETHREGVTDPGWNTQEAEPASA
jgi:hypothetical protein